MADNAGRRPRSGLGGWGGGRNVKLEGVSALWITDGVNKVFRSWAIVEVYDLHIITQELEKQIFYPLVKTKLE